MQIYSNYSTLGALQVPQFDGHLSMIPFDLQTLAGLPEEFVDIVKQMLSKVVATGTGFFTIHGQQLKKNETLRRPGAHIDGNYCISAMSWGGGGWKVDQASTLTKEQHSEYYETTNGGIILASSYPSCLGWEGTYEGYIGIGGSCEHIDLPKDKAVMLQPHTIYYGNNHFIHESLPVDADTHRTLCRITLPITHEYAQVA